MLGSWTVQSPQSRDGRDNSGGERTFWNNADKEGGAAGETRPPQSETTNTKVPVHKTISMISLRL